jgi:hypothetical protein
LGILDYVSRYESDLEPDAVRWWFYRDALLVLKGKMMISTFERAAVLGDEKLRGYF